MPRVVFVLTTCHEFKRGKVLSSLPLVRALIRLPRQHAVVAGYGMLDDFLLGETLVDPMDVGAEAPV
jgi:hypothetical protein